MKIALCITTSVMLIFLLATESANAQDSTFKLSDYKNPDYLYQSLDLDFGLYSEHTNYANTGSFSSASYTFNSGAGAVYSWYRNSPKIQAEKHISFGAGIGFSGNTQKNNDEKLSPQSQENKSNSFNHTEDLDIIALVRFYNVKKQYFEVGGTLNTTNSGSSASYKYLANDTLNSQNENKGNQLNLNISGNFLVGTGRIEQVQDARMAMYILEDLQKLNRKKRLVSNEEVIALAREITLLKYKRFFDNRLRKIAEITVIDSFLQKNGIAGATDATYFTSITDNWNYANNPIRYSGRRIFTGIEANYGYNYQFSKNEYIVPANETNENKFKYTNTGLYLVGGITYEKPARLKWQNSASAKIGIGINQHLSNLQHYYSEEKHTSYRESLPSLMLSADYGFGYYPNSRTWLTLKWWLMSGWEKQLSGDTREDKKDLMNTFSASTGPQLNAYFYLSEKLRLNLIYNGELQFYDYKFTGEVDEGSPENSTSTRWNQILSASLTYGLF